MALKYIYEDRREIQRHDITLTIEVLVEFIKIIKINLGRYMIKNKINKQKELLNPIIFIY